MLALRSPWASPLCRPHRAVDLFRVPQPLPNEVDVSLVRRDTSMRLLLERVQGVHPAHEAHRVDRAVRVPVEGLDHFQHARSLEPSQRLGGGGFLTELCEMERVPHLAPDFLRKRANVIERRADPEKLAWLQTGRIYPFWHRPATPTPEHGLRAGRRPPGTAA